MNEFARSLPTSPIDAITSPHGNSQGTSNSYTVISESKDLSDQMSPENTNTVDAKNFDILSKEESKSAEKDPLKDFSVIVNGKNLGKAVV